MKVAAIGSVLALCLASAAFAAEDHKLGHEYKPLHGGVVVEANDIALRHG